MASGITSPKSPQTFLQRKVNLISCNDIMYKDYDKKLYISNVKKEHSLDHLFKVYGDGNITQISIEAEERKVQEKSTCLSYKKPDSTLRFRMLEDKEILEKEHGFSIDFNDKSSAFAKGSVCSVIPFSWNDKQSYIEFTGTYAEVTEDHALLVNRMSFSDLCIDFRKCNIRLLQTRKEVYYITLIAQGKQNLYSYSISDSHNDQSLLSSLSTSRTSINVLNYECLVHILIFSSQREQFAVERVCKEWRKIILKLWSKETVIDFMTEFAMRPVSLDHLRELLWRGGDYVTDLDFEGVSGFISIRDVFVLINKSCKKLAHLNVSKFEIKYTDVDFMSKTTAQNLKSLKMNGCRLREKALELILHKTTELEELSIYNNPHVVTALRFLTDKCVSLDLGKCYNGFYDYYLFWKELGKWPNLKYLNLEEANNVGPKLLISISKNLVELSLRGVRNFFEMIDEGNNIDSRYDYEPLSNLKNLTSLTIDEAKLSPAVLMYIGIALEHQLKGLSCRNCYNIDDNYVLAEFVSYQSQLTYFNVSHIYCVNADLLKSVLEEVKNRENKLPFTIGLEYREPGKAPSHSFYEKERMEHYPDIMEFAEKHRFHPLLKFEFEMGQYEEFL